MRIQRITGEAQEIALYFDQSSDGMLSARVIAYDLPLSMACNRQFLSVIDYFPPEDEESRGHWIMRKTDEILESFGQPKPVRPDKGILDPWEHQFENAESALSFFVDVCPLVEAVPDEPTNT